MTDNPFLLDDAPSLSGLVGYEYTPGGRTRIIIDDPVAGDRLEELRARLARIERHWLYGDPDAPFRLGLLEHGDANLVVDPASTWGSATPEQIYADIRATFDSLPGRPGLQDGTHPFQLRPYQEEFLAALSLAPVDHIWTDAPTSKRARRQARGKVRK